MNYDGLCEDSRNEEGEGKIGSAERIQADRYTGGGRSFLSGGDLRKFQEAGKHEAWCGNWERPSCLHRQMLGNEVLGWSLEILRQTI